MSFDPVTRQSPLATFLVKAQEAVKKTDQEMTEALGFSRTNAYTAILQGMMKMPVGKIPLLARALDVPASEVLEVLLRDYSPELLEVVRKVWGPLDLTTNEKKLIEAYRTLAQGHDVEPVVMFLLRFTGAPVKIFAAGKDDYDDRDSNACREFVNAINETDRRSFEIVSYPDATHGWNQASQSFYAEAACKGKGCINRNVRDAAISEQNIRDVVSFFY